MPTKIGTAYLEIEGDFSSFDKQIKQATSGTGDKFKNIGKAAAAGLAVGAAGFVALGKASADAAIESEKSAARMKAQLKALGISYKDNAAEIDRVIQKTSQLAGLDDEDLQDAFTNIVRTTGDVNKSLNLMGLAADFARGKQIDVAKAGEIIAKVAGGNTGILSRYGVTIKEGATATEALGALQQKFAGQAEAYGKTTAGAQDRFRVAVENLQEKIGAALLPALSKMAEGLLTVIEAAQNGTGIFKTVGDVIGDIRGVFSGAGDSSSELGKSMASLGDAFKSWRDVASGAVDAFRAVWDRFGGIFVDQAQNIVRYMRDMTQAITQVLKGLGDFIAGVFTGDWSRAWDGIKSIFSGALNAMAALARTVFDSIKNIIQLTVTAIATIMSGAWAAIRSAAAAAWNGIRDVILLPIRATRDVIGNEVLPGIANRLNAAWSAARSAASTAWDAIRTAILTPIRAARDVIGNEVLPGISNRLSGAWSTIRSGADTAWDAIRSAVLTPIRAARDALPEIMDGMFNRVRSGFSSIINGVGGWAGDMKDKIVGAFKSAANLVKGFINTIIDAINLIPGVPNIKKLAMGGDTDVSHIPADKFARGGITGGGFVNKPMVMMGEEAPRHPEWVIPTNPAYRKRAKMLLGRAAQSIGVPLAGFATGGTLSYDQIKALWIQAGGPAYAADTAAAVAMAESSGRTAVTSSNPAGGQNVGLWQIWTGHGSGASANPLINAQAAVSIWRRAGGTFARDWEAFTNGNYRQFLGGGGGGGGGVGGVLDAIGGALSGAAGAVGDALSGILSQGADFILSKLPGVGNLPDWLKGTGKYVLEHVGKWIKDKVGGVLDSLGGGGGGGGVMEGTNALAQALASRFGLRITSGYRTPEQNAAANGASGSSHMKGSPSNPGAHDFMPPSQAALQAAYEMGAKWADIHDYGSGLHLHVSWFKQGGPLSKASVLPPFVGSYATGGVVPRDGLAYVHQGETITPRGEEMLMPLTVQVGGEVIDQRVVKVLRQASVHGRGAYYAGRHR